MIGGQKALDADTFQVFIRYDLAVMCSTCMTFAPFFYQITY